MEVFKVKLNLSGMSYKEIEKQLANSSVEFEGFTRQGDKVFAEVFKPVECGVSFVSFA